MTTVNNIIEYTETFAPISTAADFDNCGLLVGSGDKILSRVLVALDITPEVVAEAAEISAELIISHHPVIFSPVRSLASDSVPYLLANAGISALCLHTNLDIAKDDGVNICLARALNLQNIRLFPEEFLAIGELSEALSAKEFASYVKTALRCEAVSFTQSDRPVKIVAMCSGAGGDFYHAALAHGADAFLTGEAKHHEYLEAAATGISMVTAGHFHTEDVVVAPLASKLALQFPEVEFIKSQKCTSPVHCI